MRLATRLKDEVAVGGMDGSSTIAMYNLMSHLMEHAMAVITHRTFEKSPPAPDTPGSLEEPTLAGAGVSGGWKK